MRIKTKLLGKKIIVGARLLHESFFSIVLVSLFSKWFLKPLEKNTGKRKCLVLGNGPSLSSQLDEIRALRPHYSVMCVNNFPYSTLFEELKPEYFTLLDPFFWLEVKGQEPEATRRLFPELVEKVKWKCTLFLPYEVKLIADQSRTGISRHPFIIIRYFNRTPISGLRAVKFWLLDRNLGIPFSQNVLVSAIHITLVTRHDEIMIYGADHSWHEQIVVNSQNVVCVRQNHFKYDKDGQQMHSEEEEQHYNPVYKYSDTFDPTETFKLHELFEAWARAFKGYWELRAYADYKKTKIINRSSKTYIDAFDRKA
jgi:hypothetical protein